MCDKCNKQDDTVTKYGVTFHLWFIELQNRLPEVYLEDGEVYSPTTLDEIVYVAYWSCWTYGKCTDCCKVDVEGTMCDFWHRNVRCSNCQEKRLTAKLNSSAFANTYEFGEGNDKIAEILYGDETPTVKQML